MKKELYKGKVAILPEVEGNHRVEIQMNIRVEQAVKDRFVASLKVGRPATITDVIEHLMDAYSDETDRTGRQPEFPLEVRQKAPKGA